MTEKKASAWEWAQTALLAMNLAWTTLGRGGYPPQVMVVTSTLTATLLVVHLVARASCPWPWSRLEHGQDARATNKIHPAAWFFLPFLAYAAINVRWVSPVPWLGWGEWFYWAEIVAVFWVVLNGIRSPATQRMLFFVIILLGLAGVVMAAYQVFGDPSWQMLGGTRSIYYRGRGSGSFGMPNSLAAFLALLLPAAAALSFRRNATAIQRVWWGWVTLVLLFGLGLTISRGAWLALGLAITVWPLCAANGRWRKRVVTASVVLASVAIVGIMLYAKSDIVRSRMTQLALDAGEKTRPIMWRAAWNLFRERPLLGTGAGSYDVLFEKYRPEGFGDHTLWAHNDYLNTLSDYGVVGFALFFGACAIVSVRAARIRRDENVRRRDWLDSPTVLPALGMGLLAFALHLGVEFHFKVPALGLVVATVGAIAVSRAWPAPARSPERASSVRWWPGLAAAGCAAGYLFVLLPHFRGENLRRPARDLIDGLAALPVDPAHYRAPLEQASAALARATSLDPANGQAWADLAYATILRAHVETDHDVLLGQEAERAAERALGCSRACNEFWIRRGVARDLQGRWLEASDDFVKALELAPSSAAAWYYFAYHLSLNPAERRYADAVLETCLRLDPWSPYGLALRQRLATGQKVP